MWPILCALLTALASHDLLVSGYAIGTKADAVGYLQNFGYLGKSKVGGSSLDLVDISQPLKDFQTLAGIRATGILDAETVQFMNKSRCGNADKATSDAFQQSGHQHPPSSQRVRFQIRRGLFLWSVKDLTYRISQGTARVEEAKLHREIDSAFKLWEDAANINFVKIKDPQYPVDIDIYFARRKHDDNYPFDGPGNTLAHAFHPGPELGGDVHFDDAETWTTESATGTNLHAVAVHEIGHALGLFHSPVRGSIMQPFYGGYDPNLRLHPHDIAQIQELYGKNEVNVPSPTPVTPITTTSTTKTNPKPIPTRRMLPTMTTTTPRTTSTPSIDRVGLELCNDPHIDAITTIQNGNVYAFKGRFAYHLDTEGGKILSVHEANVLFPGLPGNIDAAVTRADGETLVFKDDKFWKFAGQIPLPGNPHNMRRHFPGIPTNVDAVFESPIDGLLYFIKGNVISKFTLPVKSRQQRHAHSHHHRHNHHRRHYHNYGHGHGSVRLSQLGIETESIEGAFVAPTGRVYLFHKNLYWRLDDQHFHVARVQPPYPRSFSSTWLNCEAQNGSQV